MKIALRCEVKRVEKRTEYSYSTNKSEEKVTSELEILKNNDSITGSINLKGDLGFGKIYQIVVDLDNPLEVVQKTT